MAIIQYGSNKANTDRFVTPALWKGCPKFESVESPAIGYGFFDDFAGPCPNTDAGLFEGIGESPGIGYLFYGDANVTLKAQADTPGGVLEVAGNTTDEDESVMSTGSPSFVISDTPSEERKLWFECRIKKASIANDALGMFVGLGWDHGDSVSVAKTLCLTDADAALGAFSFVGFHVDQANGDAVDFVVKAEGQDPVVILAGIDVPVADEFAKWGFFFDPGADTSERIALWVDGVKSTTFVTGTQIAAVTFPDSEGMAAVWAAKVGSNAAEVKAQVDWWGAYQLA